SRIPGRWTQPSVSSQVSYVQMSPSSHAVRVPEWQVPAVQTSPLVHELPSLQALPFGSMLVQLSAVSLQLSAQFESPSGPGHGFAPCVLHDPLPLQVSLPLQKRLSLQAVPGDANRFVGQLLDAPVQRSATSQTSTAERHVIVLGPTRSA